MMFLITVEKQTKKFTENIEALKKYVRVKYPKYATKLVHTVEEMQLAVARKLPDPLEVQWGQH